MIDHDIVLRFRDFAGEKRFREMTFLVVNSIGTDYFAPWNYEFWLSFQATCPEAPTEISKIKDLLLWCHVHEKPVAKDQLKHPFFDRSTLKAVTHRRRNSQWYRAAEKSFPHGHGGLDVICPDCVAAHLQWLSENPNWLTTLPNG